MWDCRYFWLSLVKMDIRTRYRGSVLGLGWSLLQPLMMTCIICFVFAKLLMRTDDIGYFGPYVLSGLCCWAFILNAALQGCHCFQLAEMYIRQYPAPVAIYPLRLVLGLAFHLVLTLIVVVLLTTVLHGIENPLALLSLIPSLAVILIMGWSLAALTGLATVHFPDTKQLCEVTFQGLFYLTPVMLTDEVLTRLNLSGWYRLNPFFWFLRLLREPLLHGQVPSWQAYAVTAGTAAAAMTLAALALRRLEKRIIFYL
jgi:ABC-type polysaccharide/polyol phosphate export permease